MKLEVVCIEKTLAIEFEYGRLPSAILTMAQHDKLSDLIVAAIPECNADGLDGGIYRQMLVLWITIGCQDMSVERETQIREVFVRIVKKFCRLK